jgi:hypothetical protein
VIGTIARPLLEYALESRRAQLQLAELPPGDIHSLMKRVAEVYSRLGTGTAVAPDEIGIVAKDGSLMGKQPAFWRQYDAVNWGRVYESLEMPVMNAVGEFDFVSTMSDHRAIADALKTRGRVEGVLFVLEGVDHDLRTFESREAAFRDVASPRAQASERAFSRISNWLRDNLRATPAARAATAETGR